MAPFEVGYNTVGLAIRCSICRPYIYMTSRTPESKLSLACFIDVYLLLSIIHVIPTIWVCSLGRTVSFSRIPILLEVKTSKRGASEIFINIPTVACVFWALRRSFLVPLPCAR